MASFQGYQRLAFFGLTVAAKTLLDFEDEFTVTMIEACKLINVGCFV